MNVPIGLIYRLDIEVLTPLHVGSGVKLLQGFDFEVHSNQTYRLNEDVILGGYWPDDPKQQQVLLSQPLSELLKESDYFAYVLKGRPVMREIAAAIKDPQHRPYLPGSSLKGAIRTAIMRTALARNARELRRGDIGRAGGRRAAQRADDRLDREVFGPDSSGDLLRALQVADSDPVPSAGLALTRVRMVPGLDVDVEAIASGTRLSALSRIDTYLLAQRSDRLRWPRQNVDLIRNFIDVCHHAARARLAHEYQYHRSRADGAHATAFYARLIREVMSDKQSRNEFLLQVGYAGGWRSKSVLGGIDNADPLLADVVHDFELDRGGKRAGRSKGYVQGQVFPKARHLAYVGNTPAVPMGWLRIRAVSVTEQEQQSDTVKSRPPAAPPDRVPPKQEIQHPTPPKSACEPSTAETASSRAIPGPHTGTVTYFNLKHGRGTIVLDEQELEIKVRIDQLRKGVRFMAKGERVSLILVQVGEEVFPQDVGPL